jgi:leucyl-tRNA synthetase
LGKKKYFIIFAYPGSSGYLHVGHLRNYTYTDVIARYKRMQGYAVLFPTGVHATGNVTIGFSMKLQRGDKDTINYLKEFGVDDETIEKLKDPYFAVEFFDKEYRKLYKMLGFSINEEYDTTTIRPEYNKFIEWQFRKLKEKGYLVQKPYYAWYCPRCGPVAVDPSETDISKGGNAEMLRFILIKFKFGEYILPCATLRPETVFGVVNLWVNPESEYCVVKYNNEKWIVSKECAKKLEFQKENVEILDEVIKGSELVGKTAINPITKREVPIFEAKFVNPDVATGIVMSVPAHAPYDYVALRDIGKLEEVGMISLIKVEICILKLRASCSLITSRPGIFNLAEIV